MRMINTPHNPAVASSAKGTASFLKGNWLCHLYDRLLQVHQMRDVYVRKHWGNMLSYVGSRVF